MVGGGSVVVVVVVDVVVVDVEVDVVVVDEVVEVVRGWLDDASLPLKTTAAPEAPAIATTRPTPANAPLNPILRIPAQPLRDGPRRNRRARAGS